MSRHVVPTALVALLEEADDLATVRHQDPQSEETMIECLCCGEWESHTETCPIPAIQKWMSA